MAFDSALTLRVASASLFILLGLAIGIVARRSLRGVALGIMLGFYGFQILVNNLARSQHWEYFIERGVQNLFTGVLAVGVAFLLPRSISPRPAKAACYAIVVSVTARIAGLGAKDSIGFDRLLGYDNAPANLLPFLHIVGPIVGIAAGVIALAASAAVVFDPPKTQNGWRNAASLALVLGIWSVFQNATLTQEPFTTASFFGELVLVIGLLLPWLVASVRTGNGLAARMVLVWPALGCLAYLYLLAPGNNSAAYFDPWGFLGVARLVGWGILVYAIVKWDLLGVPLPHFVVRRGAVAGTALATLFIVAQLAQNFFSAEYGLLTGGIVAGAFLFAASPLQRAMERFGEGRPTRTANGRTSAPSRQEEAFRDAVRLAWRDRRFDRREEVALANLADSLGLSAKRATEVRHAVELEKEAP